MKLKQFTVKSISYINAILKLFGNIGTNVTLVRKRNGELRILGS